MFLNANVVYLRSKADRDPRGLRAARKMFAPITTLYPKTKYARRAQKYIEQIDKMLKSSDESAGADAPSVPTENPDTDVRSLPRQPQEVKE